MIYKTLKRHGKPSFKNLVEYIARQDGVKEDERFTVLWNIPYTENLNEIIEAFEENDRFRKTRKNGISLYHDILSFSPEDREKIMPKILEDTLLEYIRLRSKDEAYLYFGAVHKDKDHVHLHIMASVNAKGKTKAFRLGKGKDENGKTIDEFKKLRSDLEKWQQATYPELDKSLVYLETPEKQRHKEINEPKKTKEKIPIRETDLEREIKKRTNGKTKTKKEQIHESVLNHYQEAPSNSAFLSKLQQEGFEIYKRTEKASYPYGVIHEGKKYRFSTIGIPAENLILIDETISEIAPRQRAKSYEKAPQRIEEQKGLKDTPKPENAVESKIKVIDEDILQSFGIGNKNEGKNPKNEERLHLEEQLRKIREQKQKEKDREIERGLGF